MVNNPIYQRAMFAGAPQAAPQTSVGTGITSGLVDQPMPMPQGSPIDQQEGELGMMAMSGLESAASGLQEMFGEIDEAEDIESMINTVRGDQKSMKQRYSELADLVGKEDANKTPESVLAILQPTFQIMETLQGDMPQGGLASLFGEDEAEPQEGVVEETLQMRGSMQAPGMEEAVMRMMAGEEPVRRQQGSPRFGEMFGFQNPMMSPVDVDPNSFQGIMQRRQPELPMSPVLSEDYMALPELDRSQFTYDYLQGVTPPDSRMVDPAVAGQYMEEYQQFLSPYLPEKRTPEALQEQYSAMLDPYLRKPKTREELLAEAEQFFGAGDTQNRDIQAALALAKAGGVIANTPGSLLQALTAGGSQLAGDISVIESQKAAQDRALKQFAFQEGQRQRDELNSQNLTIAQQAITASEADLNDYNAAMRQMATTAFEAGLRTDTANTKQFNDINFAAWSANNQFAGLPPVSMYYTDENGKAQVFTAQRSADGLKRVTPDGLQALPKDAKILDATSIKTLTGAGALDFSDAQRTDLLIPDTNSDIGYRQAAGFFLGGNFFVSPTGNLADARLAPEGFLVGTERDAVEITRPDGVGRVYMIPKMGANQGRRILTRTPEGTPTGGLAYALTPPKYGTDDQGNQKLVEGNPLVQTLPDTGVRYEDLTTQQVENFNRRVTTNIQALTEGQEILNLLGDAVGPYNSLKQFAMNNVGSLLPESAQGLVDFSKTVRGRDVMNRFSRTLIAASALSDRYAVAEQEIIERLNVNPNEFFANPEVAMLEFSELLRNRYNDLAEARGVLGNEQNIQYLPPIPRGNEADPYPYNSNFVDYVDMLENGGVLPKETYFQMSVGQAKRAGAPASLYRGLRDIDQITLQYTDGGFK